jgi:hypothetical protein
MVDQRNECRGCKRFLHISSVKKLADHKQLDIFATPRWALQWQSNYQRSQRADAICINSDRTGFHYSSSPSRSYHDQRHWLLKAESRGYHVVRAAFCKSVLISNLLYMIHILLPRKKVPYENYRKVFRTSQRSLEKELSFVQSTSGDLAKRATGSDTPTQDDMVASLDSMIGRVEGLKRKVHTLPLFSAPLLYLICRSSAFRITRVYWWSDSDCNERTVGPPVGLGGRTVSSFLRVVKMVGYQAR